MTSFPPPSSTCITNVVPANFLCDTQMLSRVAASKAVDEAALSALDEKLPGLEARRQLLKDEMATVEELIATTVAEQTRLRSSLAIHTSLLSPSPLRSLPAEVLSEIFLYYIALSQPSTDDVFQDIVTSHRVHTTILQVCRRWCATALNYPRIWTTILLVGSSDSSRSFAHPLIFGAPEQRAAHWETLERRIESTSTLPLNLLFHLIADGDIGDRTYAISTFRTFVHLFPRATSLSVNLCSFGLDIPDITSLMSNAEIHEPSMFIQLEYSSMTTHFLLDLLERAPLLETLKISRISIPISR
ncbi:hypothetical protein BDZ89DRAFT_1074957 [Hymenopellis radicata]|nr:hypothetical protein BDZ89DRAFT_1074957 [Hymenopellis radicata]